MLSTITLGQEFIVEKISGTVLVQKGVKDSFSPVKKGDVLNGEDLIITEKNSFIQLRKDESLFILKANSALGLNHIRKISINDLLLALAMEEIRNIHPKEKTGIEQNTAIYGEKVSVHPESKLPINKLGEMKINGAKQLAENGFVESAIIVSKDVFRKYPSTKNNFENRIYFANLLEKLNLYNETLEEYNSIRKLTLTETEQNYVKKKIEEIAVKSVKNE